jgi:hypothetical protein
VALVIGPRRLRLLGALALALALSYLITPMTGYGPQGNPFGFVIASNTRYLVPALFVAMMAGAVTVAVRYRRGSAIATVWLAAILLLELGRRPGLVGGRTPLVILGAAAGAGLGLLGGVRRPTRGRWLAVAGALMAALVVAAAAVGLGSRSYVNRWYTRYPAAGLVQAWQAVAKGHDRIGVHSIELDYPFYGPRFTNHVEWIVVRLPHGGIRAPRSCAEWRRAVNQRRLDWVVVSSRPASSKGFGLPQAVGWTGDDAAARLVVHRGTIWAYRLSGPLDPASCA